MVLLQNGTLTADFCFQYFFVLRIASHGTHILKIQHNTDCQNKEQHNQRRKVKPLISIRCSRHPDIPVIIHTQNQHDKTSQGNRDVTRCRFAECLNHD